MNAGINCVDLFCGAGGFSLGFKRAGFNIIGAVDKNHSAITTYKHNFDDVATFQQDIRKFNGKSLSERTGYSSADIDVVIGGPPCKGFSKAGKMNPDDPRNELIVKYAETVSDLSPHVVVLENVTGLLSMKDGQYIDQLVDILSSKGYNVQKPRSVIAADYGVPQLRKRVIITASKSGKPNLPSQTHYPYQEIEQMNIDEKDAKTYISVEDAIGDLSFLKSGEEATEYKLQPTTDYQKEMRKGSDTLHNHKAPNHGETVRERFAQFEYGQEMSDIDEEYQTKKHSMRRWHPEEPSPTITTLPEDFVHYDRDRIPTVRELARLQSFPDWFEFKGPRTTGGSRRKKEVPQYTQIGNAVPPKLAEAIAEGVMSHLNKKIEACTEH